MLKSRNTGMVLVAVGLLGLAACNSAASEARRPEAEVPRNAVDVPPTAGSSEPASSASPTPESSAAGASTPPTPAGPKTVLSCERIARIYKATYFSCCAADAPVATRLAAVESAVGVPARSEGNGRAWDCVNAEGQCAKAALDGVAGAFSTGLQACPGGGPAPAASVTLEDADCAATNGCTFDGRCSARNGKCVATAKTCGDPGHDVCTIWGKCRLEGDRCVATAESCARSGICKGSRACRLDAKLGGCVE